MDSSNNPFKNLANKTKAKSKPKPSIFTGSAQSLPNSSINIFNKSKVNKLKKLKKRPVVYGKDGKISNSDKKTDEGDNEDNDESIEVKREGSGSKESELSSSSSVGMGNEITDPKLLHLFDDEGEGDEESKEIIGENRENKENKEFSKENTISSDSNVTPTVALESEDARNSEIPTIELVEEKTLVKSVEQTPEIEIEASKSKSLESYLKSQKEKRETQATEEEQELAISTQHNTLDRDEIKSAIANGTSELSSKLHKHLHKDRSYSHGEHNVDIKEEIRKFKEHHDDIPKSLKPVEENIGGDIDATTSEEQGLIEEKVKLKKINPEQRETPLINNPPKTVELTTDVESNNQPEAVSKQLIEPKEEAKEQKQEEKEIPIAEPAMKEETSSFQTDTQVKMQMAPELNDSEAETDIAESPPVQRRGRLIRKADYDNRKKSGSRPRHRTNSDEESDYSHEDYIKSSKIRKSSSHRSESRSLSPNLHKSRKISKVGRDANGRTKLIKMCEKGKFEEVRDLVENGADINDCDYAGNTPLHEAALKGHVKIVEYLIKNGAIVDKQSGPDDLDTPLIDAVSNGHIGVARVLLKNGADPLLYNTAGECSTDLVDPEDENGEEMTALLMTYIRKIKENEVSNPSIPLANFEKSNENWTRRARRRDWTEFTTRTNREEIFRKAADGDVAFVGNYLTNGGFPDPDALILAARYGHTDVVSILLAFGTKVNRKNVNGLLALSEAVGRGHIETVRLLLQAGADPLKKDGSGDVVLEIAKSSINYNEEEIKIIEDVLKGSEKGRQYLQDKASQKPVEGSKEEAVETPVKTQEDDFKESGAPIDKEKKKRRLERTESHEHIKKPKVEKEVEDILKRNKSSESIRAKSRERDRSVSAPLSRQISRDSLRDYDEADSSMEKIKVVTEEEEKQRIKDAENREAYERKRLAKKRLNSQKLLSGLSEQAKRKEEERKKAELIEKERLRKQKEDNDKVKKLQEVKAIEESRRHETEERKHIRSNYPYGLLAAKFGKALSEPEIERYLPLYSISLDGKKYLVDLQAILLTGLENFYDKYQGIHKIPISVEDKVKLWQVFFPMIGYDDSESYSSEEFDEIYSKSLEKFKLLSINYISIEEFQNSIEEYPLLKKHIFAADNIVQFDVENAFVNNSRRYSKEASKEVTRTYLDDIPFKFRFRESILKAIDISRNRMW